MGEGHAQLQGFYPVPGDSTRWRNLGATQLPDGTWALKVDTELVLDGASVAISNIKVGSTSQSTATLRYLKTLDDGTVVVTQNDPLYGYKGARMQDAGAYPYYYGLVNEDGDWVIIRESRTSNVSTFEYAKGSGSFPTNWTNRAGLTYNEYYVEF